MKYKVAKQFIHVFVYQSHKASTFGHVISSMNPKSFGSELITWVVDQILKHLITMVSLETFSRLKRDR